MTTVISVERLSKSYRLGQIGTGTFSHDLNVWWAKMRGRPNPMLRIDEQDYGNRDGEVLWALRDVSFTVQQGEVLGIIVRNGAGKSTLLKILSRVTAPTSGKIKVKGRIASLLEVGTGFHPELTGRENIYLNGAILGMKNDEISRKFDEILDFAEVEKFIDTPVKRYSSGMYVRLAFAVAAHLEPEILVIDEVLAVGDAEFQKKCLGKMGDVAKEGRTVLFVSHNMAAISSLCHSGILMSSGCISANDSIVSVISIYLSNRTSSNIVFQTDGVSSKPMITKVCVIDHEGKIRNSIPMGQPFGIQVEFRSPVVLNDPILGIRINTPLGNSIIGLTNYMNNNQKLTKNVKSGVVKAVFTKPNLNQGTYYVTLTLDEGGMNCDRKADVVSIEITPHDVFGTGRIPSSDQATIFTEANWSFLNVDEVNWQ